jgi:hypothetical protein
MSCKSIFVNLGGGGGGSVNTGVLQIAGGVALDSTLRFVEDQNGTDTPIKVSTTSTQILGNVAGIGTGGGLYIGGRNTNQGGIWPIGVTPDANNHSFLVDSTDTYFRAASGLYFGTSYFAQLTINTNGSAVSSTTTITQNGQLTVKGAGGNIVSFRDSSNVQKAAIDNSGQISGDSIYGTGYYGLRSDARVLISGSLIKTLATGVIAVQNSSEDSFDRLVLGQGTASFPSIKRSGINIEVRLADDTGYGGITAGRSTEKTLEVLEVSGAMGLGFFNTPAINQPTVAIGEATYISNGGGAIHIDDTIGGYTMQQVVQALQNLGLLA